MVDKWYKSKRYGAALLGTLTALAPCVPKIMEVTPEIQSSIPEVQAIMAAVSAILAIWSKRKEKK